MGQRQLNIDLAYWYVDFSTSLIKVALERYNQCRYPEAIDNAKDTIEFSVKAILELSNRQYPSIHNISNAIINLGRIYPQFRNVFPKVANSSNHWLGSTHTIPRYGVQNLGVPPQIIYNKTEAKRAISDAKSAYGLLLKIFRVKKSVTPRNIGILNGYIEGRRYRENPCSVNQATSYSIKHWKQSFENFITPTKARKYTVDEIETAKISSKYAMIINPFGEAYPERDVFNRPIFCQIKDYVWSGGIFVTTGGFAFYYGWDVKENNPSRALHTISETSTLFPTSILFNQQTGQITIQQFNTLINFTGTLLWRELGVTTTSDLPIHTGPFNMQVFQRRSDRNKIGNIINLGGSSSISEFRAIKPGSNNVIPLLRGIRVGFGEVYPIAAIKYGYGYFIINGINMTSISEYEKALHASNNFLDWYLK